MYPASDRAILEVLEPTVGKAGAVAFLQERWGISSAETLAEAVETHVLGGEKKRG